MTALRSSFWDAVMFGFTASVTLWPDLAPAAVAMVLAAVFGLALLTLGPDQGSTAGVKS